jgi:LDH2 family malate/lactate/ureidoglycolate dehydrogenase
MAKRRGYPDRRGMGAQSDFISESFIPSGRHKEQLLMRAATLIALGIAREQVAEMLSIPMGWLSDKNGDPKEGLDGVEPAAS